MIDFITAEPDHPTDRGIIQYLKKHQTTHVVLDPRDELDVFELRYSDSANQDNTVLIKPTHQRIIDVCRVLEAYGVETVNSLESITLFKNRVALEAEIKSLLAEPGHSYPTIKLPKSWYLLTAQDFGEADREDFLTNLEASLSPFLPLVLKFPLNHVGFHLVSKVNSIDDILVFEDLLNQSGLYLQEYIESDQPVLKYYSLCNEIFAFAQDEKLGSVQVQKEQSLQERIAQNLHKVSSEQKASRKSIQPKSEHLEFLSFLSRELHVDIFGIDMVTNDAGDTYLIDINDFPGSRSVKNAGKIIGEFVARLDALKTTPNDKDRK